MSDTGAKPPSSDEAVQKATGHDWAGWLVLLDGWGAQERSHAEIARHVEQAYGVSGWWAQNVTVGYERLRGLRAVHQVSDGFAASASRTITVPIDVLFEAVVDEALRNRWLPAGTLALRSASPGKSARFDLPADSTRLEANFTAKGDGKASIQLQHLKLIDFDAVAASKARWKAALEDLTAYLTAND